MHIGQILRADTSEEQREYTTRGNLYRIHDIKIDKFGKQRMQILNDRGNLVYIFTTEFSLVPFDDISNFVKNHFGEEKYSALLSEVKELTREKYGRIENETPKVFSDLCRQKLTSEIEDAYAFLKSVPYLYIDRSV